MSEPMVSEVRGAPLTAVQAWALLGMGVISLIMTGVQSALLGALADEHRLSGPAIGLAATLEALTMAVAVVVSSIALSPRRLRLIGLASTLGLVAATFLTMGAHGAGVFVTRGVAGAVEGVMLWLASAMVARTLTPERWAALLFLTLSLVQLAISAALGAWVLPRFGADGGYALVAVIGLAGLPLALLSPGELGELPGAHGSTRGAPSPRGWLGLLATLIYTGAPAAVSVYLVPLAQAAGLSKGSARLALSAMLAAQIAGSALATLAAGRARWFAVFGLTTVAYLVVWGAYMLPFGSGAFIAVTAFSGVAAMFVPPFLLPMLIEADPTRRAALQSPGAQLFSGALGPFVAAWAVGLGGMHAMVLGSAALLVLGLALMAALRFSRPAAAPA